MLATSATRIGNLDESALVLDVGGWAKPLPRADWVIDLMPYETRGLYGREPGGPDRFGPETWIQRDLCAREAWPFHDGQFDFAVCAQTLEDLRDPVWVCSELTRVARAGYIEVPSRLEEQTFGVQGPWVGWGHHHWFVDVGENSVQFTFKSHAIHGQPQYYFPAEFADALTPEERVQTLWWEVGFGASEQILIGEGALDGYLEDFVERVRRDRGTAALAHPGRLGRFRRRFA